MADRSEQPLPVAVAGAYCSAASQPREVGRIESPELDEISGIAASSRQPGVLFVHNDSGDSPRFFAIDERGHTLAEVALPLDSWEDPEDMAWGPAPDGKGYLFFADTGDNSARTGIGLARDVVSVYRVAEPDMPATAGAKLQSAAVDALRFTYPDQPHDAEVLLIDPVSGDLYLVSKENDGRSLVFRASAPLVAGPSRKLERVGELHFGRGSLPGNQMPTAGAMTPAGDAIVIRTYSATFVWPRAAGVSIAAALKAAPTEVPTPPQLQGEAVTFAARGRGLYTVSEKKHQKLYLIACD